MKQNMDGNDGIPARMFAKQILIYLKEMTKIVYISCSKTHIAQLI